jgi:Na+-driven multidrug efflux pump
VALLSLGGLLQYVVFIYLWVIGLFPPDENLGVQGAAYACIVGPILVALASRGVRRSRYRVATTFGPR